MAAILAGVLPVFLLLALGYGLKKSDSLSATSLSIGVRSYPHPTR